MFAFTASAFKELSTNCVLLLYISADGYETHMKTKTDPSYDFGGVKTNHRRDDGTESPHAPPATVLGQRSPSSNASIKDTHTFLPGDLHPFLRKPLFVIIDSSNSLAFQNMPNLFGQPFVSLLSPVKVPAVFLSKNEQLVSSSEVSPCHLLNRLSKQRQPVHSLSNIAGVCLLLRLPSDRTDKRAMDALSRARE